ncbi:hypothetical protein JYB36_05770 [Burkholderia cenocepacia]|nr:hypothetical protein TQ36_28120 [Burkholderia cenocepacia]AMU13325.1 hypothetical protein A3203_09515 [Burkholderia cenocepacia]MBN3501310.1 hypothetical protein [Burkholderia cenocepacia]MBR8430838.1 hypothetical protein [Burkholderia cenocepacia]NGO93493.1 hypothetical protein [Burkholderia cenocepacia]
MSAARCCRAACAIWSRTGSRSRPLAGPTIRQTIGLGFLHRRERDPNLLALATVCRLTVNGPNAR